MITEVYVDVEIPKTNINLTSYEPIIFIAGSITNAPQRIYEVPEVNRCFAFPISNRTNIMKRK